jgi:enoyl-CoA hydratase/carnithine racemase
MSDRIRYDMADSIATITLDRPEKLNALDPDMLAALETHIDRLDTTTEARILIMTGAGERAFCVGADIIAWAALEPIDMWRDWVRTGYRVLERLARLRIPTIAALNGFTLGGGLELALACDLRVAVESAQLGAPEVKIGTVPGWAGRSACRG